MKMMSSSEIRNMYLNYFKEKGHKIIPSASLIPVDDPTLLWNNAGVTPLKKYFDGSIVPDNKRMVSCQKCLRTNDIESVGDATHHTFFEMLGNFSVGDYFKKEAIEMSYELLTSEKYFGFDVNKLYVTIYPNDEDAYNYWVKQGMPEDHMIRLENNFWEIGEGPCGPDSEIFYDRGEKYDEKGLGIKLLKEEIDNSRYVEIWNNVFSQFNSKEGLKRDEYPELPSRNIDTGMGFERIVLILQEKDSNYDTDLFAPIIKKIENISNKQYNESMEFRVIADHVRTLTFTISDGATFSNEGRGYILRRLLRRAARHGKKLGINGPFIYEIVDSVVDVMNSAYPYLNDKMEYVKELILKEEELFNRTLVSGEQKLEEIIAACNSKVISGADAFKLYDTYGFPCELTMEYLDEKGYTINKNEFDDCMRKQKEMARSARVKDGSMNIQSEALLNLKDESIFIGYEVFECESKVIGLIKDNQSVSEMTGEGYILLDKTPFYAEMGGQVADTGTISSTNFKVGVTNVVKAPHKQHLHFGSVEGIIKIGDTVNAKIDISRREDIAKNHSATHLLQEALKEALNADVMQAGSKVDNNNLRFDFIYQGKISDQEMVLAERLVNEKIGTKVDSVTETMTLEQAKEKGAIALFEEKYEENVRVVTLYDSIELCGGTHVKNVGDINKFAIKSFESKGSNIYRVEAATDKYIESELYTVIESYNDEMLKLLEKAKRIIGEAHNEDINLNFDVNIDNSAPMSYADIVYNRFEVANVRDKVKDLEKTYILSKEQKSLEDLSSFDTNIIESNIGKCIITKTTDYEVAFLKQLVDRLLSKADMKFIFIANVTGNNVNFIAKASKDVIDNIDCGSIIKDASTRSSGNGGGSKLFGQGGGTDITNLDQILDNIIKTLQ